MSADQGCNIVDEIEKEINSNSENNTALSVQNTEEPEDFSMDNMSFVDITAVVMEHTEDLFEVTRNQDKFSSDYLKSCKTLIKAIDYLGSAYITKHALIQRKFDTERIKPLTCQRLQEMASYHIRKCDAALKENKEKKQDFSFDLYRLLLEMAFISQRLRVTNWKAYEIKCWMKTPHKIAETAMFFTDSKTQSGSKNNNQPKPYRNVNAYEIQQDVLEAYENKSSDEKIETFDVNFDNSDHSPEIFEPEEPKIISYEGYELENKTGSEQENENSDAMQLIHETAVKYGLTEKEEDMLYNASQFEHVMKHFIKKVHDQEFWEQDPETASSYQKILVILDG